MYAYLDTEALILIAITLTMLLAIIVSLIYLLYKERNNYHIGHREGREYMKYYFQRIKPLEEPLKSRAPYKRGRNSKKKYTCNFCRDGELLEDKCSFCK